MPLQATRKSVLEDALDQARAALGVADHRGALRAVVSALIPGDDYVDQARAARLLARVDLMSIGLRPVRIVLAAASTLDHMAPLLRLWLAQAGFAAHIHITPFDTAVQAVLDAGSSLYRERPEIVWLFATHRDVTLDVAPGATAQSIRQAVDAAAASRRMLWQRLHERLGCLVLDNIVDLPADDPFGNLAGAAPWGRRALLRRYNVALADMAPAGVALFDLDHVAGLWGRSRWEDARYWFHSRHAFALDASGPVAHAAARLIAGARGLARKCLVLDLDNTLWGGTAGDDGLAGIRLGAGEAGEAFAAFQRAIKALKERGVILAACSKNDADIAAAVLRDHPDSVLRLEDFAVFVANWNNKADNVRDIAARLNIGLDALVFVDDSPLERDIVRRHLPEVAVIDLPDDPAGFVAALARSGWFETAWFSTEDAERGRYYADNARRESARESCVDMDAYLRALGMVATVGSADPVHRPRMAQLIGKSNQFHLTGTRYGEAELAALAERPGYFVRHVRLADRFGDNGLIACLVLQARGQTLHIDTWVMSCRVLGRTVEAFIANAIYRIAVQHGCASISGRYIPSPKNGLVSGLYEQLGFRLIAETAAGTDWSVAILERPLPWQTWVQASDA